MKTIIMAQGCQRRLKHVLDHPKQLLKVGDETILSRTIRLVWEPHYGNPDVAVIGWPELLDTVFGVAELHTFNEPGNCILEGIAGCRLLFDKERTVILLGDVVYSRAAIEAIYADERPVFAAGSSDLTSSTGELYAFSFTREWEANVVRLLHTRSCFGTLHKKYQPGHLRELYRALKSYYGESYLTIDDYTTDIDTEEDLETFGALVEKALADDA